MKEILAKVVEVRPNRPLFVRKLEIGRRGEPKLQIVAIHGTCATQAQYQFLWEAIEQQLESNDDAMGGLSIIAFDLFGLAQSSSPRSLASSTTIVRPEDYANEEIQKDLLAVIDRFANDGLPLLMMGHSYGPTHIFGTLQQIQSIQQRNVAGLILIGTAVASEYLPIANGGHPIMKLPVFVLNCLQRILTESFIKLAVHPSNAWLSDSLRKESNSNDMRVAKAYHTQMEWWRPAALPHDINWPPKVLLVHGAHDRIIPIQCGQHLHNTIPGSELLVVEAASHLVHMEQAPRVATAIIAFLKDVMK